MMFAQPQFQRIFSAFPRMELARIRLREMRDEDAETYYNYINHSEVKSFVPVDCVPYSVEAAMGDLRYYKSNFDNQIGISWAIADLRTDKMIGTIGLTMLKFIQRKANISYDIDYHHWNQGYAKEAIAGVMHFIDNDMKLLRVQANIAVHNIRSRGLIERFGFVKEGTMCKYDVLMSKHEDFDIYAWIK
jgi:[ribosomal protein S5]-alanine N-acetyltransferase